jgi:aminopeptidase N
MNPTWRVGKLLAAAAVLTLLLASLSPARWAARADEPYARSRDYDLQDIRTHLWFNVGKREIRGEVIARVVTLRDKVSSLAFDSVDLKIDSVTVDGRAVTFSTPPKKLIISLEHPAARGERHEILIRYGGQPKKGLYFILPDKNYPQQPAEVWTQGEAEDTRDYIPLYDYPNDRMTSEMLLTVPPKWTTISNGRLLGVKDEPDGTKTWDWKQSEPLSSYLISAIAGEFVERDDTWRGVTLRYVVPRGDDGSIEPTFARTKEMLELFSSTLQVPYPWTQYAQTSVHDFVEGGMENTSATTLSVRDLVDPKLLPELRIGDDVTISHEMAHQWFGDLVTCKDWANLWLNEGFATYMEHYWLEQHYGPDEAAYEFWIDERSWLAQKRIYGVPIVTRDFSDSTQYEGNIYTKGSWVLHMLREKLGDDDFFGGLHHYLVTNRGQNVVTADLVKSIEQTTGTNVDKFFLQWIYRAGAPQFDVSYSWDPAAHQIHLDVKQTQKVDGLVGLFDVPIEVEIATANSRVTYPVEVSAATQSFTFPAESAPQMVIFDKGDRILKSINFKKDPPLLVYQLQKAESVSDRADAAVALGGAGRGVPEAVEALGLAATQDPFWGVRVEALRALGRMGGPDAEKQVLLALGDREPWVREIAARSLQNFTDDPALGPKLTTLASSDVAYRVREAALGSIGQLKAPNAFDFLAAAVHSDSPHDMLRNAALGGLGALGDERAVPILREWAALGKPTSTRQEAIEAIARMDKTDKTITRELVSYLNDAHFDVRLAAELALGARGDTDAIAPLEELLKNSEIAEDEGQYIQRVLSILKTEGAPK